MASDDTKPTGYMSAARLAEIRERARLGTLPHVNELLAHLDALAAGPVPASLYSDLNWAAKSDGEARSREMVAAAYVQGRTAGRAEGTGSETIAHLIEARNTAQRTAEEAHATIARLQAELAEARQALTAMDGEWCQTRDALTAELAEARAALAESEAHADGMLTLCNVRTAELAAWRSATGADSVDAYDTWRAEHVDRVAAARLDGAREEREHLAAELSIEFERLSRVEHDRGERFAPGDAEGDAHDAARDAYNEAAKIVRARGQEQRS